MPFINIPSASQVNFVIALFQKNLVRNSNYAHKLNRNNLNYSLVKKFINEGHKLTIDTGDNIGNLDITFIPEGKDHILVADKYAKIIHKIIDDIQLEHKSECIKISESLRPALLMALYHNVSKNRISHYEASQLLTKNNNFIHSIEGTIIEIDFGRPDGYIDPFIYENEHSNQRVDVAKIVSKVYKEQELDERMARAIMSPLLAALRENTHMLNLLALKPSAANAIADSHTTSAATTIPITRFNMPTGMPENLSSEADGEIKCKRGLDN